jgi:dipeptidyl aminopeptidase/acylaminoacyl peptidase
MTAAASRDPASIRATTPDRPLDERLLDTRTPAEYALGPDGRTLVWALHATVDDEGRHFPADLWRSSMDDLAAPPTRLTTGRSPAWSPDGSTIAFLSDRITPGHHLPYVLGASGGGAEPRLVATLHGSAESAGWSADGRELLVLAADPGSYALDWSARFVTGADGVPPAIRRPGDARRRLFRIDVTTGHAREVGPDGLSVWEADWDGTSTVVALVSDDPSGNGWYHGRLVTLDLEARTARTILEPRRILEGVALSPDATRVAVVEGYSSDPGLLIGNVLVVDLTTGRIDDPWPDLQTVGRVAWAGDDHLWYARYDGTGTAVGELWPDGRRAERWAGDAFIGPDLTKPSLALAGHTVLATHQAHGLPPELATFDAATATWTRHTHLNDAVVDGVRFPDCRIVRWTADDGETIEARLLTPHGTTGPWPLIVAVHGGPTWNWNAYFSDSEPNGVLLADAGYAVVQPNPRGSSGRGHAFAEAVIGDPGGIDFRDLLAGVDWAIAEGIADPARIGIAGLSYGGFMAAWAVTQTDRFAASVAASVVADFRSFHLTSEVAAWDVGLLGGAWDDPGGPYHERSPVVHARRATTPTLVIAGDLDRCTPLGQGEQLFGALKAAGCATELLVLPGEGHVPVSRRHALEAIRATQAWFDRWMGP